VTPGPVTISVPGANPLHDETEGSVRRIASTVLAVAFLGACTAEPGPRPVAATVCDVLTRDVVSRLLGADELTDAGCTADPASGITARQGWAVDGLTITAYTTGREVPADAPQGQRCQATVGGRERPCLTTDDAAVVGMDSGSLVATVADGATTSSAVSSTEPAAGPFLVEFATAAAEALATAAPTGEPKATRPTAVPTATPAAPPRQDPGWEPLSTAKCVLHLSDRTVCSSVQPAIEILFDSRSVDSRSVDSSTCSFGGLVNFGDEQSAEYRIAGGTGLLPLATHTYTTPGVYRISVTATTLSGSCLSYGGTYTFTLQGSPTPATCETTFDPDRGRTYLYTMLPAGALQQNGRVATRFEHSVFGGESNTFTDEAGVRWTVMSDFASKHHQPFGWTYLLNNAPYRKFVSEPDSRGGSYEAVLMPDRVLPGTPYSEIEKRGLSYARSNWLVFGPGMPTYNITHPAGVTGKAGHLADDWKPHVFDTPAELGARPDDRHVAPTHLVDSHTTNWRTYRERVEGLQEAFAQGARYDPAATAVIRGSESTPVEPELRWIAEELQACAE
jgi:hypothetical protein